MIKEVRNHVDSSHIEGLQTEWAANPKPLVNQSRANTNNPITHWETALSG
jgi:hypothetical protein